MPGTSVVTGAFSYTGKYITRRLLAKGERVRTLTGHPGRPHPFGEQVSALPMSFEGPAELASALEGASTLYNTYWIRFARGEMTFDRAVANTNALIMAAEAAGVRKIVHISITNASAASPLPYFRGKGLVEERIQASRLSYAILRPAVVFGLEDILLNNIAWAVRRFPVFPIFGAGAYRVQPVYVDDLAAMAVASADEPGSKVVDAVGPETYTFEALVRLIARTLRKNPRLVHVSPGTGYALTRLMGLLTRDVVLTSDEVAGLMADLLVSNSPATCPTAFSGWLRDHATSLGAAYASEVGRHY